jgi:hypothetical protein
MRNSVHTVVTNRSPTVAGKDCAQNSTISTYSCIPSNLSVMWSVPNRPVLVDTKSYHIYLNRMATNKPRKM